MTKLRIQGPQMFSEVIHTYKVITGVFFISFTVDSLFKMKGFLLCFYQSSCTKQLHLVHRVEFAQIAFEFWVQCYYAVVGTLSMSYLLRCVFSNQGPLWFGRHLF